VRHAHEELGHFGIKWTYNLLQVSIGGVVCTPMCNDCCHIAWFDGD
jgi:hypothetical protein